MNMICYDGSVCFNVFWLVLVFQVSACFILQTVPWMQEYCRQLGYNHSNKSIILKIGLFSGLLCCDFILIHPLPYCQPDNVWNVLTSADAPFVRGSAPKLCDSVAWYIKWEVPSHKPPMPWDSLTRSLPSNPFFIKSVVSLEQGGKVTAFV